MRSRMDQAVSLLHEWAASDGALPHPVMPGGAAQPSASGRRARDRPGLGALVRAYRVSWSLHSAERRDDAGVNRSGGHEVELSGMALPILWIWYGTPAAEALVCAALADIAEHALRGPCATVVRSPGASAVGPQTSRVVPVRLRVAVYRHDHAVEGVDIEALPCVRAMRDRLEELGAAIDTSRDSVSHLLEERGEGRR